MGEHEFLHDAKQLARCKSTLLKERLSPLTKQDSELISLHLFWLQPLKVVPIISVEKILSEFFNRITFSLLKKEDRSLVNSFRN